LEDWTYRLSRNVGRELNTTCFTTAQRSAVLTLIEVGVDCQKCVDLFKYHLCWVVLETRNGEGGRLSKRVYERAEE